MYMDVVHTWNTGIENFIKNSTKSNISVFITEDFNTN